MHSKGHLGLALVVCSLIAIPFGFLYVLPHPEQLGEGILMGFVYLAAIIITFWLFKPLRADDIVLLRRILGTKLSFIADLCKYFVSH